MWRPVSTGDFRNFLFDVAWLHPSGGLPAVYLRFAMVHPLGFDAALLLQGKTTSVLLWFFPPMGRGWWGFG